MQEIKIYKISKLLIYIFFVYILWFQYVYGVKKIILYGSVVLAAACMFFDLLASNQSIRDIVPTGVMINIVMVIYSLFFGIFVARNQDYLLDAAKIYGSFSVVCLVVCYITKNEKSFDWLLNAIIAIDILCAFFVLFRGYYWKGYGHVLGPEHNPNSLGTAMDLGLFCLIYKAQKKQKKLILSASIMILFIYIIIGSGSRKGLFAAIIVCSLWFFQQSKRIWRNGRWYTRTALLLFIALLIVSVIYYYQNIYIKTDISARMDMLGDKTEESSRNRMYYYQLAIEYFLEKPLFGIGLQQFGIWNPYGQYAHSTYAEVIADWGLIGSLIYFVPVIWAAIQLVRMLFSQTNDDTTKSVTTLWIMEIFLGIGQIWFFSVTHLISWTIIFLFIQMDKEKHAVTGKQYKYIKG